MHHKKRVTVSIIVWAILTGAPFHARGHSQEPERQTEDALKKARGVNLAVGSERESIEMRPKIERILRQTQNRTVGNGKFDLKPLANAPFYREEGGDNYQISIIEHTSTQVQIPSKVAGVHLETRGQVSIIITYSTRMVQIDELSGLHSGSVEWNTNDPHIFVSMGWVCSNAKLPDEILAIVREELAREGLRLLPPKKQSWPVATESERLSYLLPPDTKPAATSVPTPSKVELQAASGVFASPRDVLAAYNQAIAKKDWRARLLCETPFIQGNFIQHLLDAPASGRFGQLARAMEDKLKLKIFDDGFDYVDSKELRDFLNSPEGEVVGVERSPEVRLHESVRRRVGDVPRFVADCLRVAPDLYSDTDDRLDVEGIRIEGDKASGYSVIEPPVPDPKEIEKRSLTDYLPRYSPVRFRRVNGSWLIASESETALP